MKTLVVTIPNMITEADLLLLKQVSEITYQEMSSVSQEHLAEMCQGYDYLMLNYDVVKKLDESFYSHPNIKALKGISTDITGMDWADPESAKKYDVLLMNTPGYSTESVAESVLCEILLHSRKIHTAYIDRIQRKVPEARKGINLKGRTVGIIGLGSIGTRLAEILQGIGMSVVGWNRSPKEIFGVTMMSVDELMKTSDVVCVCLKTVTEGSESTVNFLSKELLAHARHGQIIINLAGKQLVDHDALYEKIIDGTVSGYSVTRSDVLLGHNISKLDQVSMPPANAWFSDESLQALRQIWVGNIVSVVKGMPKNVVTG